MVFVVLRSKSKSRTQNPKLSLSLKNPNLIITIKISWTLIIWRDPNNQNMNQFCWNDRHRYPKPVSAWYIKIPDTQFLNSGPLMLVIIGNNIFGLFLVIFWRALYYTLLPFSPPSVHQWPRLFKFFFLSFCFWKSKLLQSSINLKFFDVKWKINYLQ